MISKADKILDLLPNFLKNFEIVQTSTILEMFLRVCNQEYIQ